MRCRFTLALTVGVFFALGSHGVAFDTKWHADATRAAMDQNGFSPDARLLCQFENYITDYYSGADSELEHYVPESVQQLRRLRDIDSAAVARLHFDALTSHSQVEYQWETLESNTTSALLKWAKAPAVKPGYRPVVLMTVLCGSLHAVQDFYSHSNWLKRVGAGGVPRTTPANDASAMGAPIWFDVPKADREHINVRTGWYPDGNRPGELYHRDENKDSTGRPLNAAAFDAATRASVDWVRRIVAATPDVPWAELKAWRALPPNLNGTWLKNADATFITTTSGILGHWDGPTPVKNVFYPEPVRNRNMAIQALGLTMNVYSQNIAISGNGATPTPHWVGYTLFHVEKDLAKGLYLQNQVY